MSIKSSVQMPMSPTAIDWDRIGDDFARQCQKPYQVQVVEFENRLTEFLDCDFALALNSGTSALHLALKVLGVGNGDIVLCSDFSFIATANPIKYLGAEPIFIDSEFSTWNMDPELLEIAIKDLLTLKTKPKAIVAAHIYGNPAQIDKLLDISNKYEIPLIEDSAQAFGAQYNLRSVGTFGTIGVYSFNNNKIFTTLGGGALVSSDSELIEKARFLAAQAKEPANYYHHKEVGYNYLISPLNASLGLVGLPFVDEQVLKFRRSFEKIRSQFKISDQQKFQAEADGAFSNRWVTAINLGSTICMQKAMGRLADQGLGSRRLWKPLRTQPVFRGTKCYVNGVSDKLFANGICLQNTTIKNSLDTALILDTIS